MSGFFHGSTTPLAIGTVLHGGRRKGPVEDLLEAYGPSSMSYADMVFMTERPSDVAGAMPAVDAWHVYEVEPMGRVLGPFDSGWFQEIAAAASRRGLLDTDLSKRQSFAKMADAYWRGAPSPTPGVHEYIAAEAKVVREVGGGAREDNRSEICDDARVWYHGSWHKFDAFQQRVGAPFGGKDMIVPIFLTCELSTARAHAGPNGWVYTVRPNLKRVFRGQDLWLAEYPRWWPPQPEEMSSIGRRLYEDLENSVVFDDVRGEQADDALRAIAGSHYDIMETSQMKQWLLDHGYDAFTVRESPRSPVSLAVLDPSRLKIEKTQHVDEMRRQSREGTGAREATRTDHDAPLPFALVRHGADVVPVLLGDDGEALLTGIDIVNNRVLQFEPEAIVGLVNAEPAAVWYGAQVEVGQQGMQMAAEASTHRQIPKIWYHLTDRARFKLDPSFKPSRIDRAGLVSTSVPVSRRGSTDTGTGDRSWLKSKLIRPSLTTLASAADGAESCSCLRHRSTS